MDEIYVTYVDGEHVDNHDCYDNTDDDNDNNYDIYGHISMIYLITLYRPSPGINRAPIDRMKMILIPIESLYTNLQF